MPKYSPEHEDMWVTKPCFICGKYVLDEDSDTCSDDCARMKRMWEEDFERQLMDDFYRDNEEN